MPSTMAVAAMSPNRSDDRIDLAAARRRSERAAESLLRTPARIQASNSALRRTRQTIAGARLANDNDNEYRHI